MGHLDHDPRAVPLWMRAVIEVAFWLAWPWRALELRRHRKALQHWTHW
jgi:hypothetical protein